MPNPVVGLIGAGTSLISGSMQADAASEASAAQSASAQAGIEEQRRQFDALQELLRPYSQAGVGAIGQQQALLGLSGADAQRLAISGLEQSPAFQSMMQQGENAMLQNASATGGLRGGNLQAAMAQFRPSLLAQQIQNQFQNLGGLTSIGQNAAAGVGNAGMNTGANIATLMGQQGAAQAGAALGRGQAFGNALGGLGQGLGMYAGMGGFGSGGGYTSDQIAAANATNVPYGYQPLAL